MAVPVINSPLTFDILTNVVSAYKIKALGRPTSYGCTTLPTSLLFDTTTGKITGAVHVAGTYSVSISATNADGTDTETLVITVTDSGLPPPPDTAVTVYQGKYWTTTSETLDLADLDSTGQPVCAFAPNSITGTTLFSTAIATKIAAVGGAGLIGRYVFNTQFQYIFTLRNRQKFASVTMPGVAPGDIVVPGQLQNEGSIYIGYPVIGVAVTNGVDLYVYSNAGTVTIPAGVFINFRVFTFS